MQGFFRQEKQPSPSGATMNNTRQELSLKNALLLYLSPKQATTNVPLRGELSRLTAFVSELPEQRLVSLFGLTP